MNQTRSSLVLYLISSIFFIIYEGVCVEAIIGGYEAEDNTFTYQIYIRKKCLSIDQYCGIGGGVIIDENFILTVAHLFINKNGRFENGSYEILAGTTNLTDDSSIIIDVITIYMPIDYNHHSNQNDVAVLELDRKLPLDMGRLSKLDLPISGLSLEGEEAIISGFGHDSVNYNHNSTYRRSTIGEINKSLKYVRIMMLNNMECQERDVVEIRNTVICACTITENPEQKWGPCLGDSGAPILYNNTVIGILSTIPISCVDTFYPSKYTKVWSYLEFIQNILNRKPLKNTRVYENLFNPIEILPR